MFALGATKPKLFNWLSVLLISSWVLVVTIIVEIADHQSAASPDVQAFVGRLLN